MSGPVPATGFMDLVGGDEGRVLLGVHHLDTPFLIYSSLAFGIGSSEIAGLDRGTPGKVHLAQFGRVGDRVVLLELNKKFITTGPSASLRAGLESFVRTVMWSAPIEEESDQGVVVDATALVLFDHHDIAERLRAAGQGEYALDATRSYPLTEESTTSVAGTRLAAVITFHGPGLGRAIRDIAPLPRSLSFVQHLHLTALPDPPMAVRDYHPASGGYAVAHADHGRSELEGTEVRIQPRFRLEPVGADPDRSVRRPIVFYVDPAVPEEARDAIVEGGNWWQEAFEHIGLRDAFRVEVLPEDLALDDPGLNTVWWVHRAGRGWSFGRAVIDPRTGEILTGRVLLGSQRVAQVTAIAEALLGPYGRSDEKARKDAVAQVVLSRVRLLAAHEIGHALGFVHNFASSHHEKPSVMDYPHPRIRLRDDGTFDVSDAYPTGLGPWDLFLVAHAYGDFEDEEAALSKLRTNARKDGLVYVADMDGAAGDAVHGDAVPWVLPGSALDALEEVLMTRRIALERFSSSVLPPRRQAGELEERAGLVQLLHRHEVEAVARLIGGVRFAYAQAGEDGIGTRPVEAAVQRRALGRLADLLRAEEAALPRAVLETVVPPGPRYGRSAEYLETRSGRVFDPLSAAEAAASLVASHVLEPTRLNRSFWQHSVDAEVPGVGEILDALTRTTFKREEPVDSDVVAGQAVQNSANWILLRQVIASLESGTLHFAVASQVRRFLEGLSNDMLARPDQHDAAVFLSSYLEEPGALRLDPLPLLPPGAPI